MTLTFACALAAAGLAAGPRYPRDLALDPSERWILTANEESSSVSLLDRASGEVLDELPLAAGGRPHAIAVSLDDHKHILAAVAETFVHSIAVIAVEEFQDGDSSRPGLKLLRRIPTGRRPMDLAFRSFAEQLLVACEGEGELWVHALDGASPLRRVPAVEGARRVAILGVLNHSSELLPLVGRAVVAGRTGFAIIGMDSGAVLARQELAEGTARNIEGLVATTTGLYFSHQVQPTESPIEPQTIEWGLVLANRLSKIPVEQVFANRRTQTAEWAFPLDDKGHSSGDPGRIAVTSKSVCLVPSGGTDRLLFVETRLNKKYYASGYGMPTLTNYTSTPSLKVGDRPVAVCVTRDEERAYVACNLDDTVVEVDVEARKVLRTLHLGPSPAETPEHRGARIFFDSDRSRGGWYSCHSCHPDGSTAGHSFNTRADGKGLAKRTPPLHRVDRTGPWGWLGRFESLEAQVTASLHKTMAVDAPPSAGDVEDVIAFLRAIQRPAPLREAEDLQGDAKHGERLFESAGCSGCHAPPDYSSSGLRDIGLEAAFDGAKRYNPPSLAGVRDRFRWLHDGRAASIEAVFRDQNPKGLHGRASELGAGELRDLIAFLKTL